MGCKLNFSESSTISRDLISKGFEKVDYRDEADIYVLNTCSVTENADKEARKLIRQAKRRNPSSAVAVIGCYAQLKPNEISAIDGVDLVLGAEEKFNLLEHLDAIYLNGGTEVIQSEIKHVHKFMPSYSSGERTRSYLKVQDGCDYSCSFCTIPLARGLSRSESIENTLKVAREVARTDAREIVLTGVNIGDFGKGQPESFFDLIQQLDLLDNIDRIRISSIEPNLLTDEIIEFCSASKKFMPHFHVPLQSGSDRVLKNMRRRYNSKLYSDSISKIKSCMPDACIGVDVIVGFPGETEADFLDTYNFLNELEISYLHVFTYSERSNTVAADLNGSVPRDERSRRSKMLHLLSNRKRCHFEKQFLGTVRNVLFETEKNGFAAGHTDNYIMVHTETQKHMVNQILPVELTDLDSGHVYGRFIN